MILSGKRFFRNIAFVFEGITFAMLKIPKPDIDTSFYTPVPTVRFQYARDSTANTRILSRRVSKNVLLKNWIATIKIDYTIE